MPTLEIDIQPGDKGSAHDAPSPAASAAASLRWLPQVLALVTIGYWLLVKSMLFLRLEYTTDLFTNLQLTRSFFEGRPLLWENGYGNHKAFHNLYVALLFYPFTRFLGAYGLFVAQALLYGWAVYSILARARDAAEWKLALYWANVAAMALGPVAFFIFEDPTYGFHYELLFVPLSVLFALSLADRSRSAWIYAALIVLTREEGAIVAWCIHVLHELLSAEPGTADGKARSALVRRLIWITLGWVLVFIAGMGLLFAMGGSHGRLGTALLGMRVLIGDPTTRRFWIASVVDAFLLVVAGSIVYLAGIPRRGLIASSLVSLVLIVPTTVATSVYLEGPQDHGLGWSPRLALFWGVALAGCLFAIERARAPAFAASRRRRAAIAIAVAGSIVAQVAVLGVRRRYDFASRFTLQVLSAPISLMALVLPRPTLERFFNRPRFVALGLSSAEDAFLRCLGRDLPHETAVTTTGGLFGRFHEQDLVWPDRIKNAWKPPELVVCDGSGRIPWEYGCLKLASSLPDASYRALQLGNLSVRYSTGPGTVVEACAAKTFPAAGPREQR